MNVIFRKFLRFGFYACLILLLVFVVVFFDSFARYFKFTSLCASEGGLVVYEKLDRDVGWQADNYFDGLFVAYIEGVKFVRFSYARDNNKKYDLYYKGGNRFVSGSYEKKISFFNSDPIYKLVIKSFFIKDWSSIENYNFKFIRLSDGLLMAEYNDYKVSVFEKDDFLYISIPRFDYAGGAGLFFEDLNGLF